ncbi:Uncharacterised protein [Raoultella planticola]|uniref:Uncharacterized protein n=1 Tax=Raoultella planticola TaxID=575 RepID=A0A485AMP3_RAOPL|nr:Uncharacterised protein [Raoultella planticola]
MNNKLTDSEPHSRNRYHNLSRVSDRSNNFTYKGNMLIQVCIGCSGAITLKNIKKNLVAGRNVVTILQQIKKQLRCDIIESTSLTGCNVF